MDALLILGGLLLIVAGMVWLVSLAFRTSLLWGFGSLIPPLTLCYVLAHWRVARKALLLAGLGVIPFIVGLSLLASRDPERLAAIFSMQWVPKQTEPELAISVQGELDGRSFRPVRGELVGGVLRLQEGDDYYASQEVSIQLPTALSGPVSLDVLPHDVGVLPEVEIRWRLPEQDLPEVRRLSHGYTLRLDLQPQRPNKLAGDFHLVLPPQYATSLSGSIEVYTDHLRYEGEAVLRSHDSPDTLSYVAKDYLQRSHATPDVQIEWLAPVSFPATRLRLNLQAIVDGKVRDFSLDLRKSAQGWNVEGDNYPSLSEVAAQAQRVARELPGPDQAVAESPAAPVDRRLRFSMERLLQDPARYQQLLVRAHTERGSVAEGRFMGIDRDGKLQLRQAMTGTGEVIYSLTPDEIQRIELLEP